MTDQNQQGPENNPAEQTHQQNDQVNDKSNAEPNKPYDKVQDGNLNVKLYRNQGQYGDYLSSSGVKKFYEDRQGQMKETSSLSGIGEHVRGARLLGRAADRIENFRERLNQEKSQSNDRER